MNTLSKYLTNRYPTSEEKAKVKEITISNITEKLEGGELDLSTFTNLEKIEIDQNFLTTPLTRINTAGLTNLKELILLEKKIESEAEKKLYEELGISEDLEKKKVVQEVQRLAELKEVKVNFKEKEEGSIFISLDQKDKQGNFCPSLVFWNLTRELSAIGKNETDKTPEFWNKFTEELIWVKDNLNEDYQKEFESLLTPTSFPTEKLEISELLTVYYPNSENITDKQEGKATVSKEIVDKTWQEVREKILTLTSQELSKNPSEEELKNLPFKIWIEENGREYSVYVSYHSNNPFKEELQKLIIIAPFRLENELLKKEKEQLPTTENFDKLTKQKEFLINCLEEKYTEEELAKINQKLEEIK